MKALKKSSERVLPPAGTHVAILTQIIDWGTQQDSFGKRRKVEVIWELPEETHVFSEEKGEQPFIIDRKFALTIGKGSALKEMIEGVTGEAVEDDEFELETLLGTTHQIQIRIKKGDEYDNVEIMSYMPLSKSQEEYEYEISGESFLLDLDNFDPSVFELLPDWKQDKIKATDEYKEAVSHLKPAAVSKPGRSASKDLFDEPKKKAPAKKKAVKKKR